MEIKYQYMANSIQADIKIFETKKSSKMIVLTN